MVMIQSALFKYTTNNIDEEGIIEPEPVELEYEELQDEVVLLMDSYFTVIVWFGPSAYEWK